MAFDKDNMACLTGFGDGTVQMYGYKSTDTKATILASGYFNSMAATLNVGDRVVLAADTGGTLDITELYIATNDGTTVTTAESASAGDIPLAQGSMLVGNSSGDAAAVDGSADGAVISGDGTDMTAGRLDGSNVGDNSSGNVIGALDMVYFVETAGGATANTDVPVTYKSRVIDAWVVNKAAGTASDTITVSNGASAITDAIDISGGDRTVARAGEINDANMVISAGGTLRVTETDGGGSDSPATMVFVRALRLV